MRPERLDDQAISLRLADRSRWTLDGDHIRRSVELPSFPDAIAFVARVGFLAEAANHHPDIDIRWRRVDLALSTHDAGGLTALDFDLAESIDAAASAAGADERAVG